jgi:two-component system, cell cycle response regulator
MYSEGLRAEGFDVRIADGPHHAHASAIQKPPDVVVTRILQPGRTIDGIDLLRRLKQHEATAHVPVLIITSLSQPQARAEAMAAGCDGYLLLPVVPETLAAEIRRVLQTRLQGIP